MKHKYQLLHKSGPSKIQKTEQMLEIPISQKLIKQSLFENEIDRTNVENLFEKYKN